MTVIKRALLTPYNWVKSIDYRADRRRTRAPINSSLKFPFTTNARSSVNHARLTGPIFNYVNDLVDTSRCSSF